MFLEHGLENKFMERKFSFVWFLLEQLVTTVFHHDPWEVEK